MDNIPEDNMPQDVQHPVITPSFNNKVDSRQFKFNFKKDDLGNKRPSVELSLPVPSVEGLISIIEGGGKGLELLLEAAADVVATQARSIVNEKEDISQEYFPMASISWETIANLPKAERRGGGIPKEVWEQFAADYIAVMPSVTGKTTDQVGNAAKIILNKFSAVKTNKPVLRLLRDQIGLYVTNSSNAEQYSECVAFLLDKAEALLNLSEADLTANL